MTHCAVKPGFCCLSWTSEFDIPRSGYGCHKHIPLVVAVESDLTFSGDKPRSCLGRPDRREVARSGMVVAPCDIDDKYKGTSTFVPRLGVCRYDF